jgi:microcystin-dependent protein
MDPFIGEIKMFSGIFAPRGFAFCNGQQMSIPQNTQLFSVIGTMYGGNGTTTFNLPNLQGQLPMGLGNGPGLTQRPDVGPVTDALPTYTLDANSLPAHNHSLNGTTSAGAQRTPENGYFGVVSTVRGSIGKYSNVLPPTATLDPATITPAGGIPTAVPNLQPVLPLNFIIALEGVFPFRPS